jgi:hypothetical protein
MPRRIWMFAPALMLAMILPAAPASVAAPFQTDAEPQLVPVADGVVVTPILTAGDVVGGDFQFTGVPDGIGVYENSDGQLEVYVNHELAHEWGDVSDARIDHLTLNRNGKVIRAGYALDGTEGFQYFCSSTLELIRRVPWYFTGEEWIGAPKGGTSIALNTLTGAYVETPQFGKLNHENVVPVKGMDLAVLFLSEDSFQNRSQGYAYFADSFPKALEGDGVLRVFVPNDPGDGEPSANDIVKGDTMRGRFVAIPDAERYTGTELNEVTEALTPFNFIRVEDAISDPADPGVVYLNDTGSYRKTSDLNAGRLYRFTFDPKHPRRATLEVILDGDGGDPILNPDALGLSGNTLMIQEDHNHYDTPSARVWAYDRDTGSLTVVARTDPTRSAVRRAGGKGVWESSGVVDVSRYFGKGYWLLDVQAHYTKVEQQGLDLVIDSDEGEGGQLILLYAPGT